MKKIKKIVKEIESLKAEGFKNLNVLDNDIIYILNLDNTFNNSIGEESYDNFVYNNYCYSYHTTINKILYNIDVFFEIDTTNIDKENILNNTAKIDFVEYAEA